MFLRARTNVLQASNRHVQQSAIPLRMFSCSVNSTPIKQSTQQLSPSTMNRLQLAVEARKPFYGLSGAFYNDKDFFNTDLEFIWYKEWLFAGHDCEVSKPGDWITLQVGAYPILIIRGKDNVIRAFHNICRHRGYKICGATAGHTARRLVCPYHLWTYDLEGNLQKAIDPNEDFNPADYSLKPVALDSAGGYLFISLAEKPDDFTPLGNLVESYLAPFDLRNAKVAHQSTIVEKGNWKMVWENNRECYHCRGNHSELSKTFTDGPWLDGLTGTPEEKALVMQVRQRAESYGFLSDFIAADDFQYRLMRVPLINGGRSFTMDGKPAVSKRLGKMPMDDDIGDVLMYHYPSTWNHFLPDHALSFRMLPISESETELVTKWLVPKDAIEGVDYELDNLTKVWMATNQQDQRLVERNTIGVSSPAYEPGPYNRIHEDSLNQFANWYCSSLLEQLRAKSL